MIRTSGIADVADFDDVVTGLRDMENQLRIRAEPLRIVVVGDLAALLVVQVQAGIERRAETASQHFQSDQLAFLGLELEEVSGQVVDETIDRSGNRDLLRGLDRAIARSFRDRRQVIDAKQLQITDTATGEDSNPMNSDGGFRRQGQYECDLARFFAIHLAGSESRGSGDRRPETGDAIESTSLDGHDGRLPGSSGPWRKPGDLRRLSLSIRNQETRHEGSEKNFLDQRAISPGE